MVFIWTVFDYYWICMNHRFIKAYAYRAFLFTHLNYATKISAFFFLWFINNFCVCILSFAKFTVGFIGTLFCWIGLKKIFSFHPIFTWSIARNIRKVFFRFHCIRLSYVFRLKIQTHALSKCNSRTTLIIHFFLSLLISLISRSLSFRFFFSILLEKTENFRIINWKMRQLHAKQCVCVCVCVN